MTDTSQDVLPVTTAGRSAMNVALDAAQAAGEVIRRGWDSQRQIAFKGRKDIVTDVDLAAEKAVLELLSAAFPAFGILAEESQPAAPSAEGASPY